MTADDPVPPSASAHVRELLALVQAYTAEVAAFGQALAPEVSDDDLAARQARLDDLRRRIALLRDQARGTPPA